MRLITNCVTPCWKEGPSYFHDICYLLVNISDVGADRDTRSPARQHGRKSNGFNMNNVPIPPVETTSPRVRPTMEVPLPLGPARPRRKESDVRSVLTSLMIPGLSCVESAR